MLKRKIYDKKNRMKENLMCNILLLGMGGEVSKGILKAIKLSGISCKIIGACISKESEGLYFCDKAYLSPYASDPQMIDWLVDICNKEHIDLVLTGVEENTSTIAAHINYLKSRCRAVFRVSSQKQLEIGGDKLVTCEWLKNNGFPFPGYAALDDDAAVKQLVLKCGFPLIAKPRSGKGSVGVLLIQNEKELDSIIGKSGYVLQEYIGTEDTEYTVGCYFGMHGELPDPIIMKRKLKHGSSWKVEVVDNLCILEYARKICSTFKPNGPLNIQLRLNDQGIPVPFELNVRFSGTTPMRAHFGFCDVKAMLYESLYQKPIDDCFHIRKGVAYRYTEEVYLEDVPEVINNELRWKLLEGNLGR